MGRRISLVGAMLLVLSAMAAAQLPASTAYLSALGNVFEPYGLLGIDARGTPTGFVAWPIPLEPQMMEMGLANDTVLLQNCLGIHHYDLTTGRRTFATLNGNPVSGRTVDEDGGLAWLQGNLLYRSSTILGTNPVLLTTVIACGARRLHGPCWNGTTGGYVSCSYGAPGNPIGVIEFFDRAGVRTRTIGGMEYITDYVWSPWSGDIILSKRFGGTVLRAAQNGVVSTVATVTAEPWRIAVEHQSTANVERFVVTRCGSVPAGLHDILFVTGPGSVRTLITGALRPAEVEILGWRTLWATGSWRVGTVGRLTLSMRRPYANHGYRLALSLSHCPGVDLGRARLHLTPDPLFYLTTNGDLPGLTRGFAGTLDAHGRAMVPPEVSIPFVPIWGLRVFGGCVTFDAHGITGATNCWGITLQ
ncbi:MAG: hypothetical protein JW751_23320 [Polyangiaceae bacterium]|nr:hypothetical protein [Polyangiaceae bacterium]